MTSRAYINIARVQIPIFRLLQGVIHSHSPTTCSGNSQTSSLLLKPSAFTHELEQEALIEL